VHFANRLSLSFIHKALRFLELLDRREKNTSNSSHSSSCSVEQATRITQRLGSVLKSGLACLAAILFSVVIMTALSSTAEAQCASTTGPSLCLHKTNSGIVEQNPGANDNLYYTDWQIKLVNNGNIAIEWSEFTDDFQTINPTGVVFSFDGMITSFVVTGSPSSTPTQNSAWNSSTANELLVSQFSGNSMDGDSTNDTTHITLQPADEVNVVVRTYYQLAVSTIYNETDAAARYHDGTSYQPVPITIATESAGGLPGALPSAQIKKQRNHYAEDVYYDVASGNFVIDFTLLVNNDGPVPLTDLSIVDPFSTMDTEHGTFSLLSAEVTDTNVYEFIGSLSTSASTAQDLTGLTLAANPDRFGLGNQGTYDGTPVNPEVLDDGNPATVPALDPDELLEVKIRYIVDAVPDGTSSTALDCMAIYNYFTLNSNGGDIDLTTPSAAGTANVAGFSQLHQAVLCEPSLTKTLTSITLTSFGTGGAPNEYTARYTIDLRLPFGNKGDVSLLDNYETPNTAIGVNGGVKVCHWGGAKVGQFV